MPKYQTYTEQTGLGSSDDVYLLTRASDLKTRRVKRRNMLRLDQWDDIRVSGSMFRTTGANAPALASFNGGNIQLLSFSASQANYCYFEIQFPHNWKVGTTVKPHLHWATSNADSGFVNWEFTWTWASIGAQFGSELTDLKATASPQLAHTHTLSNFDDIPGAGKGISSMMICRLARRADLSGDTYNTGVAYLLEFDLHIQIDGFGSDQPTSKDSNY